MEGMRAVIRQEDFNWKSLYKKNRLQPNPTFMSRCSTSVVSSGIERTLQVLLHHSPDQRRHQEAGVAVT